MPFLVLYSVIFYFSAILDILIFIGGTLFGATLIFVGLLIIYLKKRQQKVQGVKVQPSSSVVYEEINSTVTTAKSIELHDNTAYDQVQNQV